VHLDKKGHLSSETGGSGDGQPRRSCKETARDNFLKKKKPGKGGKKSGSTKKKKFEKTGRRGESQQLLKMTTVGV